MVNVVNSQAPLPRENLNEMASLFFLIKLKLGVVTVISWDKAVSTPAQAAGVVVQLEIFYKAFDALGFCTLISAVTVVELGVAVVALTQK